MTSLSGEPGQLAIEGVAIHTISMLLEISKWMARKCFRVTRTIAVMTCPWSKQIKLVKQAQPSGGSTSDASGNLRASNALEKLAAAEDCTE